MLARRVSLILPVLTFLLLLAGGVVHSTGSSLACPDWPLCYGQLLPPMRGAIFYEHSHRLLGASVGLLTLLLAGSVWRTDRLRPRRGLAALGVALVIFQGCLGGATVLLRLPPLVSIAHLAMSMAFFAWTVVMLLLLRTEGLASPQKQAGGLAVGLAAAGVYGQIILGAFVRHRGASLACGRQALYCWQTLWPESGLQWLQTSHRLLALFVGAVVMGATLPAMKAAKKRGDTALRRLGGAIHTLLLLQILMGVATLYSGIQLHVVTTHLALGALLWACLVAFYLLRGLPHYHDEECTRGGVG